MENAMGLKLYNLGERLLVIQKKNFLIGEVTLVIEFTGQSVFPTSHFVLKESRNSLGNQHAFTDDTPMMDLVLLTSLKPAPAEIKDKSLISAADKILTRVLIGAIDHFDPPDYRKEEVMNKFYRLVKFLD